MLHHRRVDVMLLDLEMPDLGGVAVAMAARELDPMRRVRIVAFSGHGDVESRRVAREAGMDEYLQKPASKSAVIEVLLRLFPDASAEARP